MQFGKSACVCVRVCARVKTHPHTYCTLSRGFRLTHGDTRYEHKRIHTHTTHTKSIHIHIQTPSTTETPTSRQINPDNFTLSQFFEENPDFSKENLQVTKHTSQIGCETGRDQVRARVHQVGLSNSGSVV